MKLFTRLFLTIAFSLLPQLSAPQSPTNQEDPFIWLEEVESDASLNWVKEHNQVTKAAFANDAVFLNMQKEALEIMNSQERIPYVSFEGNYLYNFWDDENNVRGILRRTTLEEYQKPNPNWEIVLDIDKLNKDEGKSWVYKGYTSLPPEYRYAMVYLSNGGKDATVIREFDLFEKKFIDSGFTLPEAKSSVDWYDYNTLILGTDFGPGSLTSSGYTRQVRLWKRGTPYSEAQLVYAGDSTDTSVGGGMSVRPEGSIFSIGRNTSFWESENWVVDDKMNRLTIPLPKDAAISAFFKDYVIAELYSDWLGIPEGTLIALKMADFNSPDLRSRIEIVFSPDEKTSLSGVTATKDYLVLNLLQNVRGKIIYLQPQTKDGKNVWTGGELALPPFGTVSVSAADAFTNAVMVSFQDFLTPAKLYYFADPKSAPTVIKTLPEMFDVSNFSLAQYEATSKDGTKIPYFLVSKKNLKPDGHNPTLLYGYGGFRSPLRPFYSATIGKLWLERGGVYVIANIRGGGEFGPKWHQAALLENRQRAFDDFIAVGEDLITRKITTPEHLGIMGGSNGGLLMGAVFTQRPELFNAVVCEVPLLDMLRYHKLPPGASWMGEYGNPDIPEQRAYIAKYSPYQNVKVEATYPEVLFVTSTKDDRVHPGHARKMAAKMEEYGKKVYFYENTEGGHGRAADMTQRAMVLALEYNYLGKKLGISEH